MMCSLAVRTPESTTDDDVITDGVTTESEHHILG